MAVTAAQARPRRKTPVLFFRETLPPFRQEGSSRKPSSDRLADPRGEETPRLAGPSPLAFPVTHRTSSAQYCTSPPGAGRPQPAAAALPPPSPGHGRPPRAPAALSLGWQGPYRSPPRAMAAAAMLPAAPPLPSAGPGPTRSKRLTEATPVDGTRECGGFEPGFCGSLTAFCCPANGVRPDAFASVSPG